MLNPADRGLQGYAFLKYHNQESTILAVDNFNGTKVCPACRSPSQSVLTICADRYVSEPSVLTM